MQPVHHFRVSTKMIKGLVRQLPLDIALTVDQTLNVIVLSGSVPLDYLTYSLYPETTNFGRAKVELRSSPVQRLRDANQMPLSDGTSIDIQRRATHGNLTRHRKYLQATS